MKRSLSVGKLCAALVVVLSACAGDDLGTGTGEPPQGPFRLILEGDATFGGTHEDDIISVVVVAGFFVVAEKSRTISASTDPAFSFSFQDLLGDNLDYVIYYWIDSNDGGGAVGICDDPVNDHQWSTAFFSVDGNVTLSESHNDANNAAVCEWFQLGRP